MPSASIKVDLPAPGTPVIPTRVDLPVYGNNRWITCCAISKWAAALLSIKVMARDKTIRLPASTPST